MDGKPDRIVVFFDSQDAPGAIHMTRHNMPAEPSIRSHCPFQIDPAPDHKTCKRGAVQGFMHNIGRKAVCKSRVTVRQMPFTAMLSPIFVFSRTVRA